MSRFSQALTDAVQAQGMTLQEISARLRTAGLPVSVATLSYWQSGRSAPTRGRSLEALKVLEGILELRPGTLGEALAGGSAPGPGWDDPETIRALAEWRLTLGEMHGHRAVQEHWTVSADRRRILERSRALSQVKTEVETAFPVVLRPGDPSATTPRIRCIHGCERGRSVETSEHGLFVGEVLLPRPHRHGECYWTEIEIDWGATTEPHDSVGCGVGPEVVVLTLDLRFEGEAPATVTFHFQTVDGEHEQTRAEAVVDAAVSLAFANPSPGRYWLEW